MALKRNQGNEASTSGDGSMGTTTTTEEQKVRQTRLAVMATSNEGKKWQLAGLGIVMLICIMPYIQYFGALLGKPLTEMSNRPGYLRPATTTTSYASKLDGLLDSQQVADLYHDCPQDRLVKVRYEGNNSVIPFEQFIPMVLHAVNNSVHHPDMRPILELANVFGNELRQDFSEQVTGRYPRRATVLKSGFWAEFGVFTGGTIKYAAEQILKEGGNFEGVVAGFDSFQGLPEAWRPGFKAGRFGRGATLYDQVRDAVPDQVKLYKGWFQNTITQFKEEHPRMPAALIHHDGDLFLSTTITFQMLHDRIVPGTHMIFDELQGYPGYEKHEILAFYLWMVEHSETAALCAMGKKGHFDVQEWITNSSIEHGAHEQSAWFQVLSI